MRLAFGLASVQLPGESVLDAIERLSGTRVAGAPGRRGGRGRHARRQGPRRGRARSAPPTTRAAQDVLGEIARGGVGVIFKGRDRDLGRDVAIKVLRKDLKASPEVVQRFVEEAQIGGQLQHPGIVPVSGSG